MNKAGNAIVLMVEDNPKVLKLNEAVLAREGYAIHTAKSLAEARAQLAALPHIDIAVLDILLPDGDGLSFAAEVKEKVACPVLMLTSKREYEDMVEGLTSGADDYMTKPYRIEELRARIVALLARGTAAAPPARLVRGPLEMDSVAGRAYLSGEDMLLTQKEFALLLLLAQEEGKTLSSEILYDKVWNQPMTEDNRTLKKHISAVRRKLEDGSSGYAITSVYGKGYVFQKTK